MEISQAEKNVKVSLPSDWQPWTRILILAPAWLVIGFAALFFVLAPPYFLGHSSTLATRAVWLAIIVPAVGLVLVRQRYPVEILAFATCILVVSDFVGLPRWLFYVPFVPAALNAMVLDHRRATWVALAVAFIITLWLPSFSGGHAAPEFRVVVALFAWILVLGGVAEWMRVGRERRLEAEKVREAESRRLANEERLRFAQDLHDVLGHDISLINVQASSALHVWDQRPEQARVALAAIKSASKDALTELRTALDLLRNAGESALRAPSPSLDRLGELIAQTESAGLTVRIVVTGEPHQIPAGVELAAYRIVQEALTNVMRHAGPAAALVQLAYAPGELTVQIDDDGRGPVETDGAGHGITGMRDRAVALGGTLEAKARPGGGFRVRAWLPWRVEP